MKKKTVKQYLNELSKSKKNIIKTNDEKYSVIKLDKSYSKFPDNANNDNINNKNVINYHNIREDNVINDNVENNDTIVNEQDIKNRQVIKNRQDIKNNDNIPILNDYNSQNISIKINSKKKGGNNSNNVVTNKIMSFVNNKYPKFSIKKNNTITNIVKKSFNINDYKSILSKKNINSNNGIIDIKQNNNIKSLKNIISSINREKKDIKSQKKEIQSLKNINNIEKYKILKAKKLLFKKNDYLENLYNKIQLCTIRNDETLKKINSREKNKNIEEYIEDEKTNIKIKNNINTNFNLLTIIIKKNKNKSNIKSIYDNILLLDREELLYLLELRNIKLNKNIPIKMIRDIYLNTHIGCINYIKK